MAERIETAQQWAEAVEFLGKLADEGRDGLEEAATVNPEIIIRDAEGTILWVRATVDDEKRMYFSAQGSRNAPPTEYELLEYWAAIAPPVIEVTYEITIQVGSTTAARGSNGLTQQPAHPAFSPLLLPPISSPAPDHSRLQPA